MNGLSKGSMLVCEECGLKTVLEGPLSAYSSVGSAFGCLCGNGGKLNTALPLRHERQERPSSIEPWIEGD